MKRILILLLVAFSHQLANAQNYSVFPAKGDSAVHRGRTDSDTGAVHVFYNTIRVKVIKGVNDTTIIFPGNVAFQGTVTGVSGEAVSQEQVEDFVGAMISGNTETRITVTYDDATGKLNFVVDDMNDDTPDDNTELPDMAQNTIKGRITASTGDPEDLTAAQVRTIINVEDGATGDQTVDVFSLSGNDIQLSLEDDGQATLTLDISGATAIAANTAKVSATLANIQSALSNDFHNVGGVDDVLSDSEVETAYNNQVGVVSQAEAEAGTATTVRRWTAQRVAQSAVAQIPAYSNDASFSFHIVAPDSLDDGEVFIGKELRYASSIDSIKGWTGGNTCKVNLQWRDPDAPTTPVADSLLSTPLTIDATPPNSVTSSFNDATRPANTIPVLTLWELDNVTEFWIQVYAKYD